MSKNLFSTALLALALGIAFSACNSEPPKLVKNAKDSGLSSGDAKEKGKKIDEDSSDGSEVDGNDDDSEDSKKVPEDKEDNEEPEVPKPINETGGSDDNNSVSIPMPANDTGDDIDPYLAPRMIMSEGKKQCLDLDGNTNRNGEVIQGRPCSGSTGQMIEIKKQAGGYVTLSFLGSKGCWKLRNDSFEKRTILQQWKCDGSDAQKWKLEKMSGNSYAIKPAADPSNHCVDMDTNGPTVRSTLQIYDCLGNPQQTWTLLRKDKDFQPKPQPVLSLDDMCHHKIRVYENDTSAAGKLVYETLGGRLMDRVPEIAKEVCRLIFKNPAEVIANINYMTVYVEKDLPGGIAAEAKPDGYKDSAMKFSAKHFQQKKDSGYDMAKFLKGTMAFELTHVFQYPLHSKANDKVKLLRDAMAYAIRLRTGYPDQSWKRNKSGNWDQGGLQTGLFLGYVENKNPGFLNKFNSLLNVAKDEGIIMQAVGKSVDDLWKSYVADSSCSMSNVDCGL